MRSVPKLNQLTFFLWFSVSLHGLLWSRNLSAVLVLDVLRTRSWQTILFVVSLSQCFYPFLVFLLLKDIFLLFGDWRAFCRVFLMILLSYLKSSGLRSCDVTWQKRIILDKFWITSERLLVCNEKFLENISINDILNWD